MISIIVPIYKVEKYIKQCVDSIIEQTYKNIEIILVDDGSPDNCPEICDDYASKDNRIIVIHKNNGGLMSARQAGLKAATGEYVCFIDGDDWIELDMYQKIADAITDTNADCIITQFFYSYSDREVKSEYKINKPFYNRDEILNEIVPTMLFDGEYYRFGIYPCCWTKVFRREILEKHLPDVDINIRMGEDIAFTYPCVWDCNSIAFIDEPLYHYRQNPESMTASYDKNLYNNYIIPYNALLNKSNELDVNISYQLPYYLLYLVNFVIRNEVHMDNTLSKEIGNSNLKTIINNEEVQNALSNIEFNKLPFHTKLLLISLRSRSVLLIRIYMFILKTFGM